MLSIDLMLNRLVLSYKHLLTTLVIFFLYLFGAYVGTQIQSRPIYAGHLAFQSRYTNNYDYENSRHANLTGKDEEAFLYCKDTYLPTYWINQDGDSFSVKDWSKSLWITLGTGFGALIITHLILTIVTQWRAGEKKSNIEDAYQPLHNKD